jgi:uncharacterized protein
MAKGLGPFVVGLAELRRLPGHPRQVEVGGPVPGLALSDAWVPEGAEVVADLHLELLVDGHLTASGRLQAPWVGRCRRCLRDVTGTLDVEISEVFEHDPSDEAETYPLGTDRVDLEPMVRDAVLLALPLAPLCEEVCAGPDPDDHPVGASDDAGPDPRWAALGELKFD